jgi:hypothetical protein
VNKKRALRVHAKRRAKTRYGLTINKFRRRQIVCLIQGEKGRFLKRHSRRVSEWEIVFEGKKLRLLYDRNRKEIITFLPPLENE